MTKADKDSPLPLVNQCAQAMIDAAADVVEANEENMTPAEILATLTLSGVMAAYQLHTKARVITKQNQRRSDIAFVKTAKIVAGILRK